MQPPNSYLLRERHIFNDIEYKGDLLLTVARC